MIKAVGVIAFVSNLIVWLMTSEGARMKARNTRPEVQAEIVRAAEAARVAEEASAAQAKEKGSKQNSGKRKKID